MTYTYIYNALNRQKSLINYDYQESLRFTYRKTRLTISIKTVEFKSDLY